MVKSNTSRIYYKYSIDEKTPQTAFIMRGSPVRLSEKAYHLIKEKIISLELEPLAVIDEQALMDDLGLGRTPIREALHRLAAEGLVIIAPRRGMFVAEISITDLQKIFEVRLLLEGFCARLAAARVTEGQITRMEALLDELSRVPEGDESSPALMSIDERLHRLMYEAADNEFLADSLDRLHALSMRLWYLVLDRMCNVRDAIEDHREIVAMLKVGDGEQAEALVQQHIAQFQQEIRAIL
jgi:DNA-binding GntR family transcriptional regulator